MPMLESLSTEVLSLVKTQPGPVSSLCIDMSAVDDVDFSAGMVLLETFKELKEQNVQLLFSEVNGDVAPDLQRYGVTDAVGATCFL